MRINYQGVKEKNVASRARLKMFTVPKRDLNMLWWNQSLPGFNTLNNCHTTLLVLKTWTFITITNIGMWALKKIHTEYV